VVGALEGASVVGPKEGATVVGALLGVSVLGPDDGAKVVGAGVGPDDGAKVVGALVGALEGASEVGTEEGPAVVGALAGYAGSFVGNLVGKFVVAVGAWVAWILRWHCPLPPGVKVHGQGDITTAGWQLVQPADTPVRVPADPQVTIISF
jgi:hypothetical protein